MEENNIGTVENVRFGFIGTLLDVEELRKTRFENACRNSYGHIWICIGVYFALLMLCIMIAVIDGQAQSVVL